MGRTILWARWQDPIAPLLEREPPEPDEDEARSCRDAFAAEGEVSEMELEGGDELKTGPMLVGPMGAIPVRESNLPSRLYSFWMAHTNFDLTREAVQAVEAVAGVEGLDVFTRYRMRLAVGKAFEQRAVLGRVDCALGANRRAGLAQLQKALTRAHPFWALVRRPDGRVTWHGSFTRRAVELALEKSPFRQSAITSW